ncbi:hypothetical protein Rhe02_06430 [Rhizocola hellebori]|uniref:DUF4180 domain-containing protein n=1 Tax=Rhizocola hellebori TaxID=1392758 RepID=A0A8J3VDM3_9ACTN|nr:DUF4180 domain-containing protein [Rhizocola hellebori]GIH02576.1 hypothetical protein Rhe02_06430 [Rhizocola hellebori]
MELYGTIGKQLLLCGADGPAIATVQDALDLIGEAFSQAEVIAVPATRFSDEFFNLRTGLAGEIMQKFVNYHVRLVVMGDLSEHLAKSAALRALVQESNRGQHIWFVADLDELNARLS